MDIHSRQNPVANDQHLSFTHRQQFLFNQITRSQVTPPKKKSQKYGS